MEGINQNCYKRTHEIQSAYHVFLHEPSIIEVYSWYQKGMFDVLKQISTKYPEKAIGLVANAFLILNGVLRKFNIETFFGFGGNLKFSQQFATYAQTKDWATSPIRCLAWNPYLSKIAIVTNDDSIKILSDSNPNQNCGSASGSSGVVLKRAEQKNISCISWRPLTDSDFAVACENGIFIWSLASKPLMVSHSTLTNQKQLVYKKDDFISCIDWNPNGSLLVSASLKTRSILVWNVELEQYSILYTLKSGNTLVSWAPNNLRLFTANSNLVFRIWDCYEWKSDRWDLANGHVQTNAWSPCGSFLLFATSNDPFIYLLNFESAVSVFKKDTSFSMRNAQPAFDFTCANINESNLVVGGRIIQMKWDHLEKFVAVIFKESRAVAILKTQLRPFNMSLHSVIEGKPNENANVIDFQKNINQSVLTVGWSSGRLQHMLLNESSS